MQNTQANPVLKDLASQGTRPKLADAQEVGVGVRAQRVAGGVGLALVLFAVGWMLLRFKPPQTPALVVVPIVSYDDHYDGLLPNNVTAAADAVVFEELAGFKDGRSWDSKSLIGFELPGRVEPGRPLLVYCSAFALTRTTLHDDGHVLHEPCLLVKDEWPIRDVIETLDATEASNVLLILHIPRYIVEWRLGVLAADPTDIFDVIEQSLAGTSRVRVLLSLPEQEDVVDGTSRFAREVHDGLLGEADQGGQGAGNSRITCDELVRFVTDRFNDSDSVRHFGDGDDFLVAEVQESPAGLDDDKKGGEDKKKSSKKGRKAKKDSDESDETLDEEAATVELATTLQSAFDTFVQSDGGADSKAALKSEIDGSVESFVKSKKLAPTQTNRWRRNGLRRVLRDVAEPAAAKFSLESMTRLAVVHSAATENDAAADSVGQLGLPRSYACLVARRLEARRDADTVRLARTSLSLANQIDASVRSATTEARCRLSSHMTEVLDAFYAGAYWFRSGVNGQAGLWFDRANRQHADYTDRQRMFVAATDFVTEASRRIPRLLHRRGEEMELHSNDGAVLDSDLILATASDELHSSDRVAFEYLQHVVGVVRLLHADTQTMEQTEDAYDALSAQQFGRQELPEEESGVDTRAIDDRRHYAGVGRAFWAYHLLRLRAAAIDFNKADELLGGVQQAWTTFVDSEPERRSASRHELAVRLRDAWKTLRRADEESRTESRSDFWVRPAPYLFTSGVAFGPIPPGERDEQWAQRIEKLAPDWTSAVAQVLTRRPTSFEFGDGGPGSTPKLEELAGVDDTLEFPVKVPPGANELRAVFLLRSKRNDGDEKLVASPLRSGQKTVRYQPVVSSRGRELELTAAVVTGKDAALFPHDVRSIRLREPLDTARWEVVFLRNADEDSDVRNLPDPPRFRLPTAAPSEEEPWHMVSSGLRPFLQAPNVGQFNPKVKIVVPILHPVKGPETIELEGEVLAGELGPFEIRVSPPEAPVSNEGEDAGTPPVPEYEIDPSRDIVFQIQRPGVSDLRVGPRLHPAREHQVGLRQLVAGSEDELGRIPLSLPVQRKTSDDSLVPAITSFDLWFSAAAKASNRQGAEIESDDKGRLSATVGSQPFLLGQSVAGLPGVTWWQIDRKRIQTKTGPWLTFLDRDVERKPPDAEKKDENPPFANVPQSARVVAQKVIGRNEDVVVDLAMALPAGDATLVANLIPDNGRPELIRRAVLRRPYRERILLSIEPDGAWRFRTRAELHRLTIPKRSLDGGRYRLETTLSSAVGGETQVDLFIAVDDEKPSAVTAEFQVGRNGHTLGRDLSVVVNATDNESGIQRVRVLDDEQDEPLVEKDFPLDLRRRREFNATLKIPADSLPAPGNRKLLVEVVDGRGNSLRSKRQAVTLKEPVRTGHLRVVFLYANGKTVEVAVKGKTPYQGRPRGASERTFKHLPVGELSVRTRVNVNGKTVTKITKGTIVEGKTAVLKLDVSNGEVQNEGLAE